MRDVVINVASADHYGWGDDCDGWHLVRRPDMSIIQERMPPGASEVSHYHRAARQFFFVLRGVLTVQVTGGPMTLFPGDGVEVAPGRPHQVRNDHQTDVEFLVTSWPPSHGDRVVSPDHKEQSAPEP